MAASTVDLARLAEALRVVPAFRGLVADELTPLPTAGTMHRHVRIGAYGWIARLPFGTPSSAHGRSRGLAQVAAYQRLAPAGRTPRLLAALHPRPGAPLGILVVQEIRGRPAVVPDDMGAIADSLAAVHRQPLPARDAWPPIPADDDPILRRIAIVRSHLERIATAPIEAEVRSALDDELAWAMRFHATAPPCPPPALAIVDTHPGNFVVEASGRAMCLDLDGAVYGQRTFDVAYASLSSSILWAIPDGPLPGGDDVLSFERDWLAALPPEIAARERPWLRPMRRLTWLRQIAWFARGWAFGEMADSTQGGAALRARARAMLTPEAIRRMRAEWLGPTPLPPP